MKYVALLRGINSGRNPMIKMTFLKEVFENMGFENVKTIIASGNVVFESAENSTVKVLETIEKTLSKDLGFQSNAIVLSIDEVQQLVDKNPFKKFTLNPQLRFYVTFLKEHKISKIFKKNFKEEGFEIVDFFDRAICYVLDVTTKKTPDIMGIFDKEFGKNITTRNWNTVLRILKA